MKRIMLVFGISFFNKFLLSAVVFFLLSFTYGQDYKKYSELVKEASNLYKNKEYLKSGQKYSEAFIALGGKGIVSDRYNAAQCWALINQTDSAFVQLFKIARFYEVVQRITKDSCLNSLYKDERWMKIMNIVKPNQSLIALLDTIFQDDQKPRMPVKEIIEKYGLNSQELKAQNKIIIEKDSINLIKVKKIFDERGWVGVSVIGNKGSTTLFLVIQHADLVTQEKYLPMVREAVKQGEASKKELALLEDRVALGKGEKQIYGSQISLDPETGKYYVRPLIDPDNVNKRRAEVELGTIQEYIKRWGITWDVEEYKKNLLQYTEKEKY